MDLLSINLLDIDLLSVDLLSIVLLSIELLSIDLLSIDLLSSNLMNVDLSSMDVPHDQLIAALFPSSLHLQVIYALNTKNDEHEEEMESLKDAHEDEVGTSLILVHCK